MRLFPRASRRRVLVVSAAVIAIGGTTVPLADAQSHTQSHTQRAHARKHKPTKLEQRHHAVQQREKRVGNDLDDSSAALRTASASLTSARTQLTTARGNLRQVNQRLASAVSAHAQVQRQLYAQRQQLARARSQLTLGKRQVASQRAALRTTILGEFTQGDPTLQELSVLAGGGTIEDLTRQQTYGEAVTTTQDATLQRLEAAETVLGVREQDVADATDAVAATERQAKARVDDIASLRTQALSARNEVLQLVATRRGARTAAARAKAHDRQVLARLRKREARIREQILREAAKEANRHVDNLGGMFAPPVLNTYITSPYGWRIHPIYHYWGLHDGDDLHAPCGTPERAIDTGKVISEYYSDVWGNRLYLSLGRVNGHSYTAIYNHISSYRAHVGQVVGRGDVVALAGTTGWSTACHLHFTILRDGNPVDPAPLIGF